MDISVGLDVPAGDAGSPLATDGVAAKWTAPPRALRTAEEPAGGPPPIPATCTSTKLRGGTVGEATLIAISSVRWAPAGAGGRAFLA